MPRALRYSGTVCAVRACVARHKLDYIDQISYSTTRNPNPFFLPAATGAQLPTVSSSALTKEAKKEGGGIYLGFMATVSCGIFLIPSSKSSYY